MNFNKVGSQSRKTGIFAKEGTKIDENNFEDIDDFYTVNSSLSKNASKSKSSQKTHASGKQKSYGRKRAGSLSSQQDDDISEEADGKHVRGNSLFFAEDSSSGDEPEKPSSFNGKRQADNSKSSGSTKKQKKMPLAKSEAKASSTAERTKSSKKATKSSASKAQTTSVQKENSKATKRPAKSKEAKTASRSAKTTKTIALNKNKKSGTTNASSSSQSAAPLRKSSRIKTEPLAFWRNEKAIYDYSNNTHVPSLQKVVKVFEPEPEVLPKRLSARKPKPKAAAAQSKSLEATKLPETDWMIKGKKVIKVVDSVDGKRTVKRTVAWAADKEVYNKGSDLQLAILFLEEQEFAASGILKFRPKEVKHTKNTSDTYFVFHVIQGALKVQIADSTFTVTQGCSFEVPMENMYGFENIGDIDAKLFFVQAKYVVVEEEESDGEGEDEVEEDVSRE